MMSNDELILWLDNHPNKFVIEKMIRTYWNCKEHLVFSNKENTVFKWDFSPMDIGVLRGRMNATKYHLSLFFHYIDQGDSMADLRNKLLNLFCPENMQKYKLMEWDR